MEPTPFTPDELAAFYDRVDGMRAAGQLRDAREALLDDLPRLPEEVQTEILAALISETIEALALRREVQREGLVAAHALEAALESGTR